MIVLKDERSLRAGFLTSAGAFPDRPAFSVRGKTCPYSELEETARRWANQIVTVLGRRADRVGLFAYRSEVSYAGTIACLMAGGAFVPLSPTFPPEKTASMIAQASLDAIIVDKTCAPHVQKVLQGLKSPMLLFPDVDAPPTAGIEAPVFHADDLQNIRPLADLPPLSPENTAYLLFTSGSTGIPKGVAISHGNVMHFIDVMRERYQTRPEDRFSQTFEQTFDLSVFDLFMAWHSGASVHAMSPVELLAPTKYINENGITVWFSVPSVAVQMSKRSILTPGRMPGLKWSLFCGEALESRIAEAWQKAAPNSKVENLYGPTELTIACFAHRWQGEASAGLSSNGIVPIGQPFKGLTAGVFDEDMQECAEGEPGELLVSGPQTSAGYWRDPEKTGERFVELSMSSGEPRRFYRTGDRVQRAANGEYLFLGRTDHQIKVLGHRVELGEIEATLRRIGGVTDAVAFGFPFGSHNAESVMACVTGPNVDVDELQRASKTSLPAYAVPREFVLVEEMPIDAHGKIDRRALREKLVKKAAAQ